MCQDIGDMRWGGLRMDVGRYLVEAHLREGRRVAELARVHGVHRSWLYKLLGRYRSEGEAGLVARSRPPPPPPPAVWARCGGERSAGARSAGPGARRRRAD